MADAAVTDPWRAFPLDEALGDGLSAVKHSVDAARMPAQRPFDLDVLAGRDSLRSALERCPRVPGHTRILGSGRLAESER